MITLAQVEAVRFAAVESGDYDTLRDCETVLGMTPDECAALLRVAVRVLSLTPPTEKVPTA